MQKPCRMDDSITYTRSCPACDKENHIIWDMGHERDKTAAD
jgi:hypothetical protein